MCACTHTPFLQPGHSVSTRGTIITTASRACVPSWCPESAQQAAQPRVLVPGRSPCLTLAATRSPRGPECGEPSFPLQCEAGTSIPTTADSDGKPTLAIPRGRTCRQQPPSRFRGQAADAEQRANASRRDMEGPGRLARLPGAPSTQRLPFLHPGGLTHSPASLGEDGGCQGEVGSPGQGPGHAAVQPAGVSVCPGPAGLGGSVRAVPPPGPAEEAATGPVPLQDQGGVTRGVTGDRKGTGQKYLPREACARPVQRAICTKRTHSWESPGWRGRCNQPRAGAPAGTGGRQGLLPRRPSFLLAFFCNFFCIVVNYR